MPSSGIGPVPISAGGASVWRSPTPGHRALAELETAGLAGVITQNVDGLHAAAGSRYVINLHGDIATVLCLDCGDRSTRSALQHRLASAQSEIDEPPAGACRTASGR